MPELYSQIYANSCHNGFINATSSAKGKLAWPAKISAENGIAVNARTLLCDGETIIVEGIAQISAFNNKGKQLWHRPKWYAHSVVLKYGWVFYVSTEKQYGRDLEAVDLNNKFQLQEYDIPFAGENAYVVLFEPLKEEEGIIVMVQHNTGNMEGLGPDAFIVYKKRECVLGFDWASGDHRGVCPLLPLLSMEHSVLVAATPKEALVFDINAKKQGPNPIARFPLPFDKETKFVSCGADGNLYWAGINGKNASIAVTDLKGIKKWGWQSQLEDDAPIAPPIVAHGSVFFLTQKNLFGFKNEKQSIAFNAKENEFVSATALADGSILVAGGKKLFHLDSNGAVLFEATASEQLVTAPIVDEKGRVYAASQETLYAFR